MPAVTLTTTLTELNRLFGHYYELVDKKTSNSPQAEKAWLEYVAYVRRYNEERRLKISSDSVGECS